MLIKNPITPYNVNEFREVGLKSYLLRQCVPIALTEKVRTSLKGEGVYYSKAFNETKSIFVHIPKAAGTSVSNALYGGRQGHHTALAYKKANPSKFAEYYKFTITRNPWDRLASTYHYLLKSPHAEDRNWAKNNIEKYSSFESFVINWLSSESIYSWKHLLPQTYFVYENKKIIVDNIFKLESLSADFETLKVNVNSSAILKHDNKVSRAHYESLYTKRMVEHVGLIYSEDINEFAYEY